MELSHHKRNKVARHAPTGRRSNSKNRLTASRAFSLVELLVVVLVVAVLTAIAIPYFSDMTAFARIARDQRNAQTIVSMASAARAAGYTNNWGSVADAIDTLFIGILSTNSIYGEQVFSFRLNTLSQENRASAATYIRLSEDTLIYDPSGGQQH